MRIGIELMVVLWWRRMCLKIVRMRFVKMLTSWWKILRVLDSCR